MQNDMKRLIVMFSVITLFGCGILKTGRSPAAVSVSRVMEVNAEEKVKKHVSAFTAQDLYRSRAEKLRKSQKRASRIQQKESSSDDAYQGEPISKKSIVEIIQIVDESGIVVASKKVN